jgi:hypothetical protein
MHQALETRANGKGKKSLMAFTVQEKKPFRLCSYIQMPKLN